MENNQTIIIVLAVILLASFILMPFGTRYGYSGMMGMYGGFGDMFFGWIFMSALFILVILAIIWLSQQIKPRRR